MITGAPPGNNPPALLPSAKTGVYRKRPFGGASVNHRALSLPDVSRLGSPKVIAPSATCGVIARELLPPPSLVPLLGWRRIPTTLMRARGRPPSNRRPSASIWSVIWNRQERVEVSPPSQVSSPLPCYVCRSFRVYARYSVGEVRRYPARMALDAPRGTMVLKNCRITR